VNARAFALVCTFFADLERTRHERGFDHRPRTEALLETFVRLARAGKADRNGNPGLLRGFAGGTE